MSIHVTKHYYPRSFLNLLLLGFAVVVIPLGWSLVDAAFAVARLANRSQQAVYDAAQAARGSRELAELIVAMERTLRQYIILGDIRPLENLQQLHADFGQTAAALSRLRLGENRLSGLPMLIELEQATYARLTTLPVSDLPHQEVAEDVVRLADLAQSIVAESNSLIDQEVDNMRADAANMQHGLYLRLIAIIPAVLLAAFTFTVLIARPIRQIDHAIRRMGLAELDQEISVTGPRDLVYVGERLDWLRRRLLELEEQKTKFMRAVSHELKNPLAALREGASLLHDGSTGELNEEQRDVARIVFQNSVYLQKLIEDLLDYQRSQAADSSLRHETFDLAELARTVALDHQLAARARHLQFDFRTRPCAVHADRDGVRTIVDNLYTNAVKYSPRAGLITVKVRAQGGHAVLSVADQGPGVPAEERERIFEPFYQGRIPPEGPVKGSGLGLAIARELAGSQGGSLELAETGSGTTFCLSLPVSGQHERANHAKMAP